MDYINYWQYFNIDYNACDIAIKTAFVIKFKEIYNALKVQNIYSINDLIICIKTYETLTTPYFRFLHNAYLDEINVNAKYNNPIYECLKDDFAMPRENAYFSDWLFLMTQKLNSDKDINFMIVKKLYDMYLHEKSYALKLKQRS